MTGLRPLVELDEQTKHELQPPCDARRGLLTGTPHPCGEPAEWIVHFVCPSWGPVSTLNCDEHLTLIRAGRVRCRRCGESEHRHLVVAVSWELL